MPVSSTFHRVTGLAVALKIEGPGWHRRINKSNEAFIDTWLYGLLCRKQSMVWKRL